jgi:cytochrome P450
VPYNNNIFQCEKKNTIDEITNNLFMFLLAGFDTSANTLGIISHNLAMHPDVQDKLYAEIEAICGAGIYDDEPTSYEQLNQLKYTEAVIKESLRLCPIAAG